MELKRLEKRTPYQWVIEQRGKMRVPVIIYADEKLVKAMDEKVYEQACNVAVLPGIVKACCVMPDAHWGYGFPIGGVGAFDAEQGGVVSAGGVGFDISCGVRTLTTGIEAQQVERVKTELADQLARTIPAGLGSTGRLRLNSREMDDMLSGGAAWAVERGYGTKEDLRRIEEDGQAKGANPRYVSDQAKKRQEKQVGTLGSGNHYLEVQKVVEIYDEEIAGVYGLVKGEITVSIHCGSRGLGHQIATDYLKKMISAAKSCGIELAERELACAPIKSPIGEQYLGAMRAGINCALANRQVLTDLLRKAFAKMLPQARLVLLYDVSHNTCKLEEHEVDGSGLGHAARRQKLFVHRKGATRSYGPGHPDVPAEFRKAGQPVIIGGTMGTASYILAGTTESLSLSFGSSCHGAGRSMSRNEAKKRWHGKDVTRHLAEQGVIIRSPSLQGVAEEAPGAYKDVSDVVKAAHEAKLSKMVARLEPMVCIKG